MVLNAILVDISYVQIFQKTFLKWLVKKTIKLAFQRDKGGSRMANVVERIEENLGALSSLLGEENVEDVKKRIANLIVQRVADDMKHYNYYLFYPGDYQEAIGEAFEQAQKKIVKMYKDAMLESAQESVTRFKDMSIAALNDTQGLQLRSCHKCNHCNGNMCKFYEDKYWKAHDTICAEEGFIQFVEKEEKR